MFKLDLDVLHRVAMADGMVGRAQGKTVYWNTVLLQRLELSDADVAFYWLRNRESIGRVIRQLIEIATYMEYKVIDATCEHLLLDIGEIRFIMSEEKTYGIKYADLFKEKDEDPFYS